MEADTDNLRRCPVGNWCARAECNGTCQKEARMSEERAAYNNPPGASWPGGATAATMGPGGAALPAPGMIPQPPMSREDKRWLTAAMAMQGLLAGHPAQIFQQEKTVEIATGYADALLAALERSR